jgi:hypothetical protein
MAMAYDAGTGYIKQLHVNNVSHYTAFPVGLTELTKACLTNGVTTKKKKTFLGMPIAYDVTDDAPPVIEWVFGLPSNAGL